MILKNSKFNFKVLNGIVESNDETFADLMEEEIHGILVKNFLSKEETEIVKNKIKNITHEKKTTINDGFRTFPLSFAQFTQMLDAGKMNVEDYIKIAEDVLANQISIIGTDIVSKLIFFLERHSMIRKISPVIEKKFKKPLIPFNVRELSPGNGELIVHCENLFF